MIRVFLLFRCFPREQVRTFDTKPGESQEHDHPGPGADEHRRLHQGAAVARSCEMSAGQRNLGAAEVPGC